MKEIQVFGAGGQGFAVIELIRSLNEYTPVCVFDDDPKSTHVLGVPVESDSDKFGMLPLVIAIGNNSIRKEISEKIKTEYPSFIHESAIRYPSSKVGQGTVVFPNSVIDADAHLGDFCIVNNNATVSHNARIGDFVHVAIQASVAGNVAVGSGTLIGAGSIILPEVTIGKWVTIGAGAVVTKDVPDNAVVFGNPAKIVRYNS